MKSTITASPAPAWNRVRRLVLPLSGLLRTGTAEHDPLPEFTKAAAGTVLDQLDQLHADREAAAESRRAERWVAAEIRALALLRGEPDPCPVNAVATDDVPDVEPLEYEKEVAAMRADRQAKWASGEVQPHVCRRIDFDEEAGVYTSRKRRRGGEWSEPFAIDPLRHRSALPPHRGVSCAQVARLPRTGRTARGSSRPAFRRSSSPTRAGPDDAGGSDPGPGPRAAAWRLSSLGSLTPAAFHEETDRLLVGVASPLIGPAKARIFEALPERLKDSFAAALNCQLDAPLEHNDAKGGAV